MGLETVFHLHKLHTCFNFQRNTVKSIRCWLPQQPERHPLLECSCLYLFFFCINCWSFLAPPKSCHTTPRTLVEPPVSGCSALDLTSFILISVITDAPGCSERTTQWWMDVAAHTEVADDISPLWYLLLLLLDSKTILLNHFNVISIVWLIILCKLICDWFSVLIYDICNVPLVALKGTNTYSSLLLFKRNHKHKHQSLFHRAGY